MTRPYSDIGWFAGGMRKAGQVADRITPPTNPVDRDPCQRCGVRADFGCAHSRAPVGTMFGFGW